MRSLLVITLLLVAAAASAQESIDQVNLVGSFQGLGEARRGEVVFHVLIKTEKQAVHLWCVARKHQANLVLNASKGDIICLSGHHVTRVIEHQVRLVIFADKIVLPNSK